MDNRMNNDKTARLDDKTKDNHLIGYGIRKTKIELKGDFKKSLDISLESASYKQTRKHPWFQDMDDTEKEFSKDEILSIESLKKRRIGKLTIKKFVDKIKSKESSLTYELLIVCFKLEENSQITQCPCKEIDSENIRLFVKIRDD